MIWDPFQAAAEAATGARTLADGTGIVSNYQFYFASNKYSEANQPVSMRSSTNSARSTTGPRAIPMPSPRCCRALGIDSRRRGSVGGRAYGIKPINDVIIEPAASRRRVFELLLIPRRSTSDATKCQTISKVIEMQYSGSCRPTATAAISGPRRRARGQLQLSAPDRAGGRPARLFRRAAADRATAARIPG